MFLRILVGFREQVDKPGNYSGISERSLIFWAQGQVTDQANCCLKNKKKGGSEEKKHHENARLCHKLA